MELQDIDLKSVIESETGDKFDRQGYINCPFHKDKTPSLSVKYHPDLNKEKFKCFGCDEGGDAIDFIQKYKGLDYVKAKEHLGIPVEKTKNEKLEDKIKSYIEWELTKTRVGQKLLGLFTFVNESNEPVYFKAKFMDTNTNRKKCGYYHLENDKVVANRGTEEIPYNYYRVIQALREEKVIVVVEGEKDANTINSLVRSSGYEATSFKGVINIKPLPGSRIYICPDTGVPGDDYKWKVYHALKDSARELKFITLPGLKHLGDNKDVTDWIDMGHTKQDLLNVFNRSLDVKCKWELQQDSKGIYKMVTRGKGEEMEEVKKHLTNFKLLEATRISFKDEDQEGVKLLLKSATGEKIERLGAATVFDDVRAFKNFLGSMDLSFSGRIDDLTELKTWINKFFALEMEEIYEGAKFIPKDDKYILVTPDGSLTTKGIDKRMKSREGDMSILEVEDITKEELKKINKHLFKFATPEKTLSIIGSIINNLAVCQNEALKLKLHHLFIIGESGSGKSTVAQNVIAPILNYNKEIKSIGLISSFAIIKEFATGNYPIIFDEFKPSKMDRYKNDKLSDVFRNLYQRTAVIRGDKSLKTKTFKLARPLILLGEEGFRGGEKPLIERSCIVYLSRMEREKTHTEAMNWLTKNEDLLNKLGKSLVNIVLNLTIQEYSDIRDNVSKSLCSLNNRILNTGINICTGLEIYNILLRKLKLAELKNYTQHVIKNIEVEVLEEGEEVNSAVEQMLILYNDMIEDGRALSGEVIKNRTDGTFIKTSEMINQIHEHVIRIGSDVTVLSLKDFKKQAKKAGYIRGVSDKLIKVANKPVRFDTYDRELLRSLKVSCIVEPEYQDVTEEERKLIPFG